MQDSNGLKALFQHVDSILCHRQALWRSAPFTERPLHWESKFPELASWLKQRSLSEAEADHLSPELLNAPAPFDEWVAELAALPQLPMLNGQQDKSEPASMEQGIPGRKWQQIQSFARSMQFKQPAQHWLDWCAGKGFLGRYLAWPTHGLSAVEWDALLCANAQQLNAAYGVQGTVVCCDALSTDAHAALADADTWVALHACGDLHTSLLRHAQDFNVQRIAVAPCCYNRIKGEHYQPLSTLGKNAKLRLTRSDLSLPLQSTVTAGRRDKRLRDQAMAWRLAFDELQRATRGVDEYMPIASVASRWMQQDFAGWCQQVAEFKEVELPAQLDWNALEQRGWQLLAQIRNLELVQCLYRRPLELWLLLDMALFLQEQGFSVQLGNFCETALTPRNALILAERF